MKKKLTVYNGIDRISDYQKIFRGKRVGMLTAASGVDREGMPSFMKLSQIADLRVLFAPEHGIYTNAQDGKYGTESVEPLTGARIINLNSRDYSEAENALRELDLLCYDIQDVGARFYTYVWSLYDLMQICGRIGVPVVILDRINMLGGTKLSGAILDRKYASFIGRAPIPTRYGLTVGELVSYLNETESLGCDVMVIPVEGWDRTCYMDETDLIFVNPSPNIPSVSTAVNYIGTCLFEASNLSEGRGTTRPFDHIGAPFLRAREACDYLRSFQPEGVLLRPTTFTPQFQKFAGETCNGIEFHVTDRDAYDPIPLMIRLWKYLRTYPEFEERQQGLSLRLGTDFPDSDEGEKEFFCNYRKNLLDFQQKVAPFLLY